jgi:hypothetical protein
MLRRVTFVTTGISEEGGASIIMVRRINELGTALAHLTLFLAHRLLLP